MADGANYWTAQRVAGAVPAAAQQPLSLTQLAAALWRQRQLVLAAVGLCVLLAGGYLLVATPLYTATARVFIDSRQQKIVAVDAVLPALTSEASVIEAQAEFFTAPHIAAAVIRATRWPAGAAWTAEPDAATIRAFVRAIDVARIGLSAVLEVSFSDPDAAMATRAVNSLVETYIADQIDAKTAAARSASAWLASQVAELRGRVQAMAEDIERYKSANDLIEVAGVTIDERQIADYTAQLILARARLAEAQAQAGIDRASGRIGVDSRLAEELAAAKVVQLESGLATLKSGMSTRAGAAIGLAERKREAAATEVLYSALLRRQKETEAQETLAAADARIIARALPPEFAAKPRKLLLLALALALGAVLGAVVALIREAAWPRVTDDAGIATATGLPRSARIRAGDPAAPNGDIERLCERLLADGAQVIAVCGAEAAASAVVTEALSAGFEAIDMPAYRTALHDLDVAEPRGAPAGRMAGSAALADALAALRSRHRVILLDMATALATDRRALRLADHVVLAAVEGETQLAALAALGAAVGRTSARASVATVAQAPIGAAARLRLMLARLERTRRARLPRAAG